MTNPVAIIRHVADGELSYDGLMFICPGCQLHHTSASGLHMLPVNALQKTPSWTWDGNLLAPTLSPSILTHLGPEKSWTCHSYLTSGIFNFLSDCTHALANQQVALPPLPDWVMD